MNDISVVMPAYNVGASLASNVRQVVGVLQELTNSFEVILLDDGSKDGSFSDPDLADIPGLVIVRNKANQGKGSVVLQGLNMATGKYIGFIDSDGDLNPSVLAEMYKELDSGTTAALGSKYMGDSTVDASVLRKIYSSTFRSIVRYGFQLPVNDTQTGVKLFEATALKKVLPKIVSRGFVLDVEILYYLNKNGASFKELPILLERTGESTIKPKDIIKMGYDIVELRFKLF